MLSLFLCGFKQLMVVRYDDASAILKAFLIILYLLILRSTSIDCKNADRMCPLTDSYGEVGLTYHCLMLAVFYALSKVLLLPELLSN